MKLGSQEWLNSAPVRNTPAPRDLISAEFTHLLVIISSFIDIIDIIITVATHLLVSEVSSTAISWTFCGRQIMKWRHRPPMKSSRSESVAKVSVSVRVPK